MSASDVEVVDTSPVEEALRAVESAADAKGLQWQKADAAVQAHEARLVAIPLEIAAKTAELERALVDGDPKVVAALRREIRTLRAEQVDTDAELPALRDWRHRAEGERAEAERALGLALRAAHEAEGNAIVRDDVAPLLLRVVPDLTEAAQRLQEIVQASEAAQSRVTSAQYVLRRHGMERTVGCSPVMTGELATLTELLERAKKLLAACG